MLGKYFRKISLLTKQIHRIILLEWENKGRRKQQTTTNAIISPDQRPIHNNLALPIICFTKHLNQLTSSLRGIHCPNTCTSHSINSIFGDLHKVSHHFMKLLQSRQWEYDGGTIRTRYLHIDTIIEKITTIILIYKEKPDKLNQILSHPSAHLRYPQEMTSVIAPKIKEESLLISSDHLWNPHVTYFILCRQINWSVHIQFRSRGRLATVTRYETSPYIIWKPNKTFWLLRSLLFWCTCNKVEDKEKRE